MAEQNPNRSDIDQFIHDRIDTVPHLEALLLLWNSRPKLWSVGDVSKGLFVSPESAKEILEDLARMRLIERASENDAFAYEFGTERDRR